MRNEIRQIEIFVKRHTSNSISHDYDHVDRVRRWAVLIAKREKYPDLAMVEIAALFHDVGRPSVKNQREHGWMGAKIAGDYLRKNKILPVAKIEGVVQAIAEHNTGGKGKGLTAILKDADILDLLGNVGIMRACASCGHWPHYDHQKIKGETWGMSSLDFNRRFKKGLGIGKYLVDQLNFQASCIDNIATATARRIGKPLAKLMTDFIKQLEREITIKKV